MTGQVLGTPGYMPPEQAMGRGTVGPAADIYSLGAVLYHLLTGRAPFVGGTPAETMRHVVEQEPVSPQLLNPEVPRDLVSVCLKCLNKRPEDRYSSASDLAADLHRFLRGEPTLARPAGQTERLWRWCQRKPALATAISCALLIGIVGFGGILWQWQRAEQHANRETQQRKVAERNERTARQQAYASDMLSLQQALAQHHFARASDLLRLQDPPPGQEDLRGWEWWYWAAQCTSDESLVVPRGPRRLVSSPHLSGVIAGSEDGSIDLWNLATQEITAHLCEEEGRVVALATDGEGRFLATQTIRGRVDGPVKVWDVSDVAQVRLVRALTTNWMNGSHAISSAGRWVALAVENGLPLPARSTQGEDRGLTGLWNWDTGERVRVLPQSGSEAAFTVDGHLLATGSWEGAVKIWSADDWNLRQSLPSAGRVLTLEFSPDGNHLVTANAMGEVLLWEVATGRLAGRFSGHSSRVPSLNLSPDGRMLATAGDDRTIGLWDVATQRELRRFKGHTGGVRVVAFSSDGDWLASVADAWSGDGAMRFWNTRVAARTNVVLRPHSLPVFTPDHQTVATGNADGRVDLWNLDTGKVEQTLPIDPNPLRFSDDGNVLTLAAVSTPLPLYPNRLAGLTFWDRGSQTSRRLPFSPSNVVVSAARLSPDGAILATGDPQGQVILWDAKTGTVQRELAAGKREWESGGIGSAYILNLEFTPAGDVLAIGFNAEKTRLWNLRTDRILPIKGMGAPLAFSPDGTMVATGDYATIRLTQTATGEEVATLRGHRERISWLAFAKDGRTLASAGEEIKLWNLATGRELGSILPNSKADFVTFSPDGRRLLGGRVGEASVWTAAQEKPLPWSSRPQPSRALNNRETAPE